MARKGNVFMLTEKIFLMKYNGLILQATVKSSRFVSYDGSFVLGRIIQNSTVIRLGLRMHVTCCE